MNVTLTLIGQMGTFAVLIWFVMKFLWNPVLKAMEDRSNRIAEGLAAAEQGIKDREEAEAKAQEELREAREQAKEIIAQANKRGEEIVRVCEERRSRRRRAYENRSSLRLTSNSTRRASSCVERLCVWQSSERILDAEVDAAAHNASLEKLAAEL